MILGVLLHTANVYAVHGHWQIHDRQTHPLFDLISEGIHIFRMPALFMISGFFAQMTFEKKGYRNFLQLRFQRLLIPLISTALLCNTVQIWLHPPEGCGTFSTFSEFLLITMPCAVQSGIWVQHLWFLIVVLVYCVVCLPFAMLLRETENAAAQLRFLRTCSAGSVLFALPLVSVGIIALQHFIPVLQGQSGPLLYGIIEPAYLVAYLPFFAFGMWLFTRPVLLDGFSQFSRTTCVCMVTAAILHLIQRDSQAGVMNQLLGAYVSGLMQWLGCHLCFCIFRMCCSRPSRFFSYLSDASYSIYLFHHLAIVATACLLLQLSVSAFLKFTIVVVLAGCVTLLIHELLIRRIPLLKLLFNGK